MTKGIKLIAACILVFSGLALGGERDLIGVWSSGAHGVGDVVDLSSNSIIGTIYNVEQWQFNGDKTYRNTFCGSGSIISGCAVTKGKYRIDGMKIILYDNKETWIPDPTRKGQKPAYKDQPEKDKWMWYALEDGGKELKLHESPKPPTSWLNIYHRIK